LAGRLCAYVCGSRPVSRGKSNTLTEFAVLHVVSLACPAGIAGIVLTGVYLMLVVIIALTAVFSKSRERRDAASEVLRLLLRAKSREAEVVQPDATR
jgi:hypothetical protein